MCITRGIKARADIFNYMKCFTTGLDIIHTSME